MISRTIVRRWVAALMMVLICTPLWPVQIARAQTTPSIVSACSGVSLPRSVVTDIMGPVITGVVTPLETTLNAVLGVVRVIPIVGQIIPAPNTNATGLLTTAASGQNITLQALDVNGQVVGPGSACVHRADGYTLGTAGGLSIGGNSITGLGAAGQTASAGDLNAIAFGNSAATSAGSLGGIAIGHQAAVTGLSVGSIALGDRAAVSVANSLALGAGSTASRGLQAGYTALGLTAPQTSVGEVSFGTIAGARQLTHVAAGSAATDAVNVSQLQGVSDSLTSLANTSVRYTDASGGRVALSGASGSVIANLAAGLTTSGSTEAVNGGQVFTLAGRIASGFGGTTAYNPVTNHLNVGLSYNGSTYSSVQDVLNALGAPSGGVASPFLSVLSTGVAASVSGLESVAIGPAAVSSATNSVALGAGSTATRGALTGYTAVGLTAPQVSLGEVSIGSVAGARQLTHVAAGSAATDAVNVSQLQGVSDAVTSLASTAVRYTDALGGRLQLSGASGSVIGNLAAGLTTSGSTEAVNGGQVFNLAGRIASGFGGTTAYNPVTNNLSVGLSYNGSTYTSVQDVLNALGTPSGAANPFLSVLSSGVAASVSGADSVAIGPASITSVANSVSLGAGSTASRGALTGYTALGLTAPQTSIGEVSVGSVAGARQLTHVAAGTQATDAVNLGQLQGVSDSVTALASTAVRYTDALGGRLQLSGASGSVIGNLAAGLTTSGSTEAVNGGQVFNLAGRIASGFGGTTAYNPVTNNLSVGLNYNGATYTSVQDVLNALGTPSGGPSNPFLAFLSSGVAASVSGADSIAVGPSAVTSAANSVSLGAGSSASRGALSGYTALGLTAPQISVGEVSFGSAGAARQLTNVAAGSAATDAVNVAQLTGVSDILAGLSSTAVRYSDVVSGRIVLAGTGASISNLTAAALSATSSEAVNGAQLFDTNGRVAANTTTINNHTTAIADLRTALTLLMPGSGTGGGASPYLRAAATGGAAVATEDDTLAIGQDAVATGVHSVALGANSRAERGPQTAYSALGLTTLQNSSGEVSIGSAGMERQLTHVAAGSADTDAVNVSQLRGVSDRVETIAQTSVRYDTTGSSRLTLSGAGGTTVTNVAAGQIAAGSTDAVNGDQLFATNRQVAANTAALANLTAGAGSGGLNPIQYSNATAPTVANGGVRTNDLTLVGAGAGPVGLHNVADGRIEAGSTDAVNGGQIYRLTQASVNAVQYDTDASGARTGNLTLSGATPVTLSNVGAGTLSATSTQAVNGAQLYATNQSVATARTEAAAALSMGMNSVQYSNEDRTQIRLGGSSGQAVRMSNLAAGVAADDAVNVQQMNDSIRQAVSDAASYTDMRLALAQFQMTRVRDELNAGSAGALAAAALPQISEPGRGMMAVSFGAYEGQSAMAIGYSRSTPGGGAVIRAGATYDSMGRVGLNGGIGWRF